MRWLVNPVVGLVLRSQLHPLLSRRVLLLTYNGRRSGRQYTLPVQYAKTDGVLYLVPGRPERKLWWRNLWEPVTVTVLLEGWPRKGRAHALQGDPGAMIAGLRAYLERFPSAAKQLGVTREPDRSFSDQSVADACEQAVLVTVESAENDGEED